jgi:peroxiredoxin Q/BCP
MVTKPDVGDSVPDFTLSTDGNGAVSSAQLRGAPAVIYFYPKDDTSGCTKQAIAFSALKPRFEKINTKIVGISADTPEKHDKFKQKHDLTITLASDGDLQALNAFGVWVEKNMYGRKYMGIERSTFLIDAEGRIAKVWRKVKVAGHAEAVLEAAEELRRA